MKKNILIPVLIVIFLVAYIILKNQKNNVTSVKESNMKLTTVFENNTNIPSKYTCDGENIVPELNISEIPPNAKELVLIVDDPDAPGGTFVHWILFNISTSTRLINAKSIPEGSKQGLNDFGKIHWGGPCPPSGTHRYFFKLYAVDKDIDLPEGATKTQVEKEIQGHIIEKSEIFGLYKRQ